MSREKKYFIYNKHKKTLYSIHINNKEAATELCEKLNKWKLRTVYEVGTAIYDRGMICDSDPNYKSFWDLENKEEVNND